MRILHVTDTYLPRLGGIELHVADLAARQRSQGHEVLVLTAEHAPATGTGDRAEDVPVVRLGAGPIGIGIGTGLAQVLAGFAPDVLHAHLSVGSPFTWAVLRKARRAPTLASLHSLLPRSPTLVRTGIRLIGIPASRVTFTAVSEAAAQRLRPALPHRQPVDVLHNGIDPEQWAVRHRASGTFNILSVGRLVARKRPLVLIEALAELARLEPFLDWTATLVGDGSQRAKVAAAVRAHGLTGRVRLAGALDRRGIRSVLASTDVFVAPAKLESFGIAALEARCAGVPIVGMASSGLTEFVTDGRDGLLASSDADIAHAVRRLATDPDLLGTIRDHNATEPVAMAWSAVLDQHDELYAKAIAEARRPSYRTRAGTS